MDQLRLAVVPTTAAAGGGFHVEIYVNDVEVTGAGAGLGMDTFDLLIPLNKLSATSEGRRVAVARCDCGVYGCGATDVVVQRVGDTVRWDWLVETPMDRSVEFDARDYDAEVLRVARDHRWETPERTAGRLVLEELDRSRLEAVGLELAGACNDWRNADLFTAWMVDPGRYQVVVDFDWSDLSPAALAEVVCRTLAEDPPQAWRARWLGNTPQTRDVPPAMAGPGWSRLAM